MRELFHRLLSGDEDVPGQLVAAAEFWRTFHSEHRTLGQAELTKAVGSAQFRHEHIIEDRHAGKMSMPFVAIGVLYDEGNGFDENLKYAVRLSKAFLASHVSVEVHSATRDAVLFYDLYDYDSDLKNVVSRQLR